MNRLWAPWRRKYVSSQRETPGCIFCNALERRDDEDSLIVHVGRHNFIIMNQYPYNSGHVMVAPLTHVGGLQDSEPGVLADMMAEVRLAEKALQVRYRPHGFNLGMNLGSVSGAGVPGHLHMHIVPRWEGDTNFMTVLGEVRVIPEDLQEAARELRKLFPAAEA